LFSVIKGISKSTGKDITDQDIVDWANNTVSGAGKSSSISSFKDSSLRTSHFVIDLLAAIRPSIINYELVTPGESDADATQNAKYAISIARKLGAAVFCLPEDIVEIKPKMIMTLIGSLMAVALGSNH